MNGVVRLFTNLQRNFLCKRIGVVAIWLGVPSISIIEAMSTGLPIMIAGNAKPREDAYDTAYLLEYGNGLNSERGDVKQTASSIGRMASDERLRKEMSTRSRKLVEEKLNWDRITDQYLEICEKVLNA